jgi:transcriptional regulator with XRE-family HTH domain
MAGMDEFIGDRIRRLRERMQLSQVALQRVTRLGQSTIYRAEVGGVVTPETARRLAAALGCDPDDLLSRGGRS